MSGTEEKLSPWKPLFLNPGLEFALCPFQHQSDACRLAVPVWATLVSLLFVSYQPDLTLGFWPASCSYLPMTGPTLTVAFDLGRLLNSLGLELNKNYVRKKIKETDFQTISSDGFAHQGNPLLSFCSWSLGTDRRGDANISTASSFLFSAFVGGAGASFTHFTF